MVAPAQLKTGVDDDEARDSAEHAGRLIARLAELAPELEGEVEGNEQLGMLSARTLDLLRSAELPRMLLPVESGGLGMFLIDALRVLEQLCMIDGSIGWIGGNWSTAGVLLSYLQPAVAQQVLAGGDPLFGASGAPTGRAVPVPGGYQFSGAWSYGSGDLQADYVLCAGMVLNEAGQPTLGPHGPVALMFAVPAEEIEPRGNWDTLGLRATGSIDFAVVDKFVPAEMAVDLFGASGARSRQLAGGFASVLPLLHTSFALGAARRLLNEIVALAQRPSGRGTVLADNAVFRSEIARQEVAVRSARAFVYDVWTDADLRLKSGGTLTRRDSTLLRAAMIHAHDVTRALAVFAFAKGSGVTLRSGSLQRRIRDALAGCQHMLVGDAAYPDIGWELMGAPAEAAWTPAGLTIPGQAVARST